MVGQQRRTLVLSRHVIMVAVVLLALAPVYWLLTIGLKSAKEFSQLPPTLWPHKPTLEWFRVLLVDGDYFQYIWNSMIVGAIATAICIVTGSMAAYGLSRFSLPFGLNYHILFFILAIRMFPQTVTVVPLFIFFSQLGLLDTHIGLGLVHSMLDLPLAVWMMLGFFKDIPRDMEESALVDGDHWLGAFRKVVLPMVRPGMAATSVLVLIASWNEFLFALILTQADAQTLPIAVARQITQFDILYGRMMAASTIAMVPVLIFALLVQRHLIRGLTLGGVSGA